MLDGPRQASLTVVDQAGLSGTDWVEIVVREAGAEPPVCKAAVTPTSGVAPLAVVYEGIYADADGLVEQAQWLFDDESEVAGERVDRTHDAGGVYGAIFTVTDSADLSCRDSVEVSVSARPRACPWTRWRALSSGPRPGRRQASSG